MTKSNTTPDDKELLVELSESLNGIMTLKQRTVQSLLEQLDLVAHGLRGQVQTLRRRPQAAQSGGNPKIVEMVIIESAHGKGSW